jgi:hypothetical protein
VWMMISISRGTCPSFFYDEIRRVGFRRARLLVYFRPTAFAACIFALELGVSGQGVQFLSSVSGSSISDSASLSSSSSVASRSITSDLVRAGA